VSGWGRRPGAALLCAAALAAGCGSDDEKPRGDTGAQSVPETTERDTSEADAPSERNGRQGGEEGGSRAAPKDPPEGGVGSPEDQPGGAGDEIPARSQALITGRGGRLSPRRVRVPPFISVRVELHSADGGEYTLRGGGQTLTAGGRVKAVTADFDGLRPGRRLALAGPAGTVTIEASAEPGP